MDDTNDRRINIIINNNAKVPILESIIILLSKILFVITFPVSIFLGLLIIQEYERAVIFRLGRMRKGARGPGIFILIPCIDTYIKVDLRTSSFSIPPQEILSKDAVTVQVDAVVYYHVKDPLKAIVHIKNFRVSTQLLAQTTLRNIAGTQILMDLLAKKYEVSQAIGKILEEATDPWGVDVERVEIKDVRLPLEMQRAMAAEAEAVRMAKAKIVAAQGEVNASKSLRAASDVMAQNPISLQLRYLQTLSSISADHNRTIIFPFPVELFKRITGSGNGKCDCNSGK